jgi:hypothetical protein
LCLPSHYSWLEVGLDELAISVISRKASVVL